MYVRNTDPQAPSQKKYLYKGILYGYYNTPKSHYYVEYHILYCTRYKVQLHPHIILHLCPIPKSGPGANEITYPPASTGLKRRLKWARGQAVRVGE